MGLFSFRLGVKESEELKNPGDFEGVAHTLIDADQSEEAAIFIMRNVGADQSANAGRVNVRDVSKVDNESCGSFRAQSGLELE